MSRSPRGTYGDDNGYGRSGEENQKLRSVQVRPLTQLDSVLHAVRSAQSIVGGYRLGVVTAPSCCMRRSVTPPPAVLSAALVSSAPVEAFTYLHTCQLLTAVPPVSVHLFVYVSLFLSRCRALPSSLLRLSFLFRHRIAKSE